MADKVEYIVSAAAETDADRAVNLAADLANVYAQLGLIPQFPDVAAAKAAEADGWEGKVRYIRVTIEEVDG
jgi:hypothetical protein